MAFVRVVKITCATNGYIDALRQTVGAQKHQERLANTEALRIGTTVSEAVFDDVMRPSSAAFTKTARPKQPPRLLAAVCFRRGT